MCKKVQVSFKEKSGLHGSICNTSQVSLIWKSSSIMLLFPLLWIGLCGSEIAGSELTRARKYFV